MKLKLLTLAVYLLLVSLFFSGCQAKEPITVPNEDMIPIVQTNYYFRLPAGYQFNPFWKSPDAVNSAVVLVNIDPPATHPEIWIWPVTIDKPENFKEDFLTPEKISSDSLSIYIAKFAFFEEDQETQILAHANVVQNKDGEAEGLGIRVFGAFSQQEEGYQALKELLQSIIYIAPTPEP